MLWLTDDAMFLLSEKRRPSRSIMGQSVCVLPRFVMDSRKILCFCFQKGGLNRSALDGFKNDVAKTKDL